MEVYFIRVPNSEHDGLSTWLGRGPKTRGVTQPWDHVALSVVTNHKMVPVRIKAPLFPQLEPVRNVHS
jgi:hypothetical protein